MSQLERQQQILSVLKKLGPNRSISVKELVSMFYASESSIRRDIITMERQGLVSHSYGGIMLEQYRNAVMPLQMRDSKSAVAKEQIARLAAEEIKNGDTIFLDSSSTVRRILQYIGEKRDLRIITNNLRIFSEIDDPDIKLYCTGGTYNSANHNFLGHAAESYIRNCHADVMFFSGMGLSPEGDINDISEEETAIRRVMLSRATRKIFLCDSSKVGVCKMLMLCNISEVDRVICDRPELIEEICKKNRIFDA